MYERHRTGGNYLTEDAIRGKRSGSVKRRAHRIALRLDEDLYRALREEAEASGLSFSAVGRLAMAAGVARVSADRIARTLDPEGTR